MTTSGLRRRARRRYAFLRCDAVLISFPKCGRTWLRLMIGRALALHFGLPFDRPDPLIDLEALTRSCPGISRVLVTHDDKPHRLAPEDLRRSKSAYRRKKVILLVRDPRDVIVSLYFERTRRDRDYPYLGTLEEFVAEPVGGLESLLAFYSIWAAEREVPSTFLLVRYEDLHADPLRELRRVLEVLGVRDVPDGVVAEAVDGARFERMRAMEEQGEARSGKLRPGRAGDPTSYKTREGKVGGHRLHLPKEAVLAMDERIRTLPPLYGYGAHEPGAAQA